MEVELLGQQWMMRSLFHLLIERGRVILSNSCTKLYADVSLDVQSGSFHADIWTTSNTTTTITTTIIVMNVYT